jgi:hypothetical protein
MIQGNKYTVAVSEDTDFFEGWTDPRVPNLVFLYDQESIEDCQEIDGIYYATYETWDVTEAQQMTYLKDGLETTVTIEVGEYGKLLQL